MTIPFSYCDRYWLLISDAKYIHVFGMKFSVTDKPKKQQPLLSHTIIVTL
jgi:hypothetical protein